MQFGFHGVRNWICNYTIDIALGVIVVTFAYDTELCESVRTEMCIKQSASLERGICVMFKSG